MVIVLCFYRGGLRPHCFAVFQGRTLGVEESDGRSQGRRRGVRYSPTERGWLHLHSQAGVLVPL